MYDSITKQCTCNRCSHSWRSRGEEKPKTCSRCTSKLWDDGSRKFDYIIAKHCEELKFCFIDILDKPDKISEDVFYFSQEDFDKYLKDRRISGLLVFVGSFEINESQQLKVNELKLIYRHDAAGNLYFVANATCIFSIRTVYEKQRAEQFRKAENERLAALEQQRTEERLQAALRRIEEEEAQRLAVLEAKRTLSDEAATTEEKIKAVALLERVR